MGAGPRHRREAAAPTPVAPDKGAHDHVEAGYGMKERPPYPPGDGDTDDNTEEAE